MHAQFIQNEKKYREAAEQNQIEYQQQIEALKQHVAEKSQENAAYQE